MTDAIEPHFSKRGWLHATDTMRVGDAPKAHKRKRKCRKCKTPLSKYNPGPRCYTCSPFKPLPKNDMRSHGIQRDMKKGRAA